MNLQELLNWLDREQLQRLTEEQTFVYSFSKVSEQDTYSIMDEVLETLNQNSILVEGQDLTCTYYTRK